MSISALLGKTACIGGVAACCCHQIQKSLYVKELAKKHQKPLKKDPVERIEAVLYGVDLSSAIERIEEVLYRVDLSSAITETLITAGFAGVCKVSYETIIAGEAIRDISKTLADLRREMRLGGSKHKTPSFIQRSLANSVQTAHKALGSAGRILTPAIVASTVLNVAYQGATLIKDASEE